MRAKKNSISNRAFVLSLGFFSSLTIANPKDCKNLGREILIPSSITWIEDFAERAHISHPLDWRNRDDILEYKDLILFLDNFKIDPDVAEKAKLALGQGLRVAANKGEFVSQVGRVFAGLAAAEKQTHRLLEAQKIIEDSIELFQVGHSPLPIILLGK